MAKNTGEKTEMAKDRYPELKQILEGRRREILSEVQEKMRDVQRRGRRSANGRASWTRPRARKPTSRTTSSSRSSR